MAGLSLSLSLAHHHRHVSPCPGPDTAWGPAAFPAWDWLLSGPAATTWGPVAFLLPAAAGDPAAFLIFPFQVLGVELDPLEE